MAVEQIRCDERHRMIGPPACLGRMFNYYRASKEAGMLNYKYGTSGNLHFAVASSSINRTPRTIRYVLTFAKALPFMI